MVTGSSSHINSQQESAKKEEGRQRVTKFFALLLEVDKRTNPELDRAASKNEKTIGEMELVGITT